jgi:plastocyanin
MGSRLRETRLPLAGLLGIGLALACAAGSLAAEPTIEATGTGYGYSWSPSRVEIAAGGTAAFKNSSPIVEHGVTWTGGPGTPACSGVPIKEAKTSWSGSCSFSQAGTYTFVCTAHPTEMKGSVVVSSGEAPPTGVPPGSGELPGSPLAGPASSALKISKSQHGTTVRGSIALSQAGAGGSLEVVLLARRASLLGAGHRGTMRVGRLLRYGVGSGRVSFAVSLTRLARRALRDRPTLSVTVRVVVTPPKGKQVELQRGVMLHD